MGKKHRHSPRPARLLLLGLLGLLLLGMQGCAFLPFAATTAASFALPQTASLAMTGAKAGYRTAFVASDERDVNTIMRDNMLTLKAKSALLTDAGASDVHVYAYISDVFAVGVVATQADRDRVIQTLQAVKGVDEVKGVIRLKNQSDFGAVADAALQNYARIAVGRYLLHKNAGVEIEAVQGELCLLGVVGTHAEALDLIQYVETVSGARALSMLAIRDEYGSGRSDTNHRYLLSPSFAPHPPVLAGDPGLPNTPIVLANTPRALAGRPEAPGQASRVLSSALASDLSASASVDPPVRNKARQRLSAHLKAQARREKNPQARQELLALAEHIGADHELSISDRLAVAVAQVKTPHVRSTIQTLLAQY